MFSPLPGLVVMVGGAGARAGAGGEPADEGVETAGDAMTDTTILYYRSQKQRLRTSKTRKLKIYHQPAI
jgi:hypothetical protein